ncbi:hypothetical protein pb186bvf_007305 [Paramecium bursaria]
MKPNKPNPPAAKKPADNHGAKAQPQPVKKVGKDPHAQAQAKGPVQPAQPQQQIQQVQQQPAAPVQQVLAYSQAVQLPKILAVIEKDKSDNLVTMLVDYTGNAYTFFKYKGELIDLSELNIQEQIKGKAHEQSIEQARKTLVASLKLGGTVVFHMDITAVNIPEFLKSDWFKEQIIFSYQEIHKEQYYKKQLLKPEEDVDNFGNKGHFMSKQELNLVLLFTSSIPDKQPEIFLHEAGLFHIKNQFRATKIIE